MRVHVHVHMYAYMCVCAYVYLYMYMHTRRVYIRTRVGAFCLFVLSNPSTTYMRVYHRCVFNTCMRVRWGIESGDFFQLVQG